MSKTNNINILKLANAFGVVFMLVLLINCSDTYRWIDRPEPRFYFDEDQEEFSRIDSVKTFFKGQETPNPSYSFKLTANIDEILKEMIIQKVSGGVLEANGEVVTTGTIIPLNEYNRSVKFVFTPTENQVGTYVMEFLAKDLGGKIGRATTYTLVVFKNLPPIAALKLVKTDREGEVTFDASGSVDRDTQFGGSIKQYTYAITGAEVRNFIIEQPTFIYGFPKKGQYTVSLQVTDSDGALSENVATVDIDLE